MPVRLRLLTAVIILVFVGMSRAGGLGSDLIVKLKDGKAIRQFNDEHETRDDPPDCQNADLPCAR